MGCWAPLCLERLTLEGVCGGPADTHHVFSLQVFQHLLPLKLPELIIGLEAVVLKTLMQTAFGHSTYAFQNQSPGATWEHHAVCSRRDVLPSSAVT